MGTDPLRVAEIIRTVMSAAKGEARQKELGPYFRANLPESSKRGEGYPDDRTIGRWLRAIGVPAEAFVLAGFRLLEEGGSLDELLGDQKPLAARVAELEEIVFRWVREEEARVRAGELAEGK